MSERANDQKIKGTYLRAANEFVNRRFSAKDRQRVFDMVTPEARAIQTRVDKAAVLEELAAILRRPLTPDEEHRRRLGRAVFPHDARRSR